MGKTGISVKGIDRDIAEKIVRTFSEEDNYLKNIIAKYVPRDTRMSVDDMDYSRLLKYGYVVLGIAKRILKTSSKKERILETLPKKESLEQLSIFS